jgi:nicotinate phosphoribosyltransferase
VSFGVGTRLITSHGDPALGGVYKLVAIDDGTGTWKPAIKISESIEKMPVPGEKTLIRAYDHRGLATADIIAVAGEEPMEQESFELFHPHRETHRTVRTADLSASEDLLENMFADGLRRDGEPDLESLRKRRRGDLERLDRGVRRLVNPHIYHVSLTRRMKDLQLGLIEEFGS